MTDEGLLIPIQFSLEEARAALAQLEAQARAAGAKIGDGVSAPATKGFAALKTEMGRGRETAMFFTQALGEFGPQGRTAQIAISGIAGAFLGGGGLLAALGLAQAGIRLLVDAWEEEEKAAKAAADKAKEAAEEQAKRSRDAVLFGNDRIATLKAMVAGFKETTAAERAQAEVAAINAQIQMTAAGPHRRMLEQRLAEAKVLAEVVRQLENEKKARDEEEASFKEWLALRDMGLKKADGFVAQSAEGVRAAMDAKAQAFKDYVATLDSAFNQIQSNWDRGMPPVMVPELPPREKVDEMTVAQRAYNEALRENEAITLRLDAIGPAFFGGLARSSIAAFGPMLTQSRAYTQAMKAQGREAGNVADLSAAAFAAIAQNTLAATAQEAAVESLMSVARGISYSSTPGLQGFAAGQFLAAAKFGAIAGIAGAGAMVIGNTRGMTASEKASVDSAGPSGAPTSVTSGGAREFSGGSSAAAGVHTRELIVVLGSPFESPAETARRAARTMRLADELNMVPARSTP